MLVVESSHSSPIVDPWIGIGTTWTPIETSLTT